MKKLMILAVAAIGLVACSKTFDTNESPQVSQIGFTTWTEHLTKATVDNTFEVGDNFAVFGYKTKSATNTNVFTGANVQKTANPNTWSCTPAQYWDTDADSYTFYGIAPYSVGSAATLTPSGATEGAISATAITFTGTAPDVLIAEKKTVLKTDGSGNFNSFGAVPMVFHHAAALLDVQVKVAADLAAAGATVQVTGIQLQNIDSEASLAVATGYTNDPVASATWTTNLDNGNPVTGNFSGSSNLNTDLSTTPTTVVSKLIVLPQTFRTSGDYIQKLDIAYTIQQTGGNPVAYHPAAYTLKLFDNIDNEVNTDTAVSGWVKGTHYTYIITIDANKISFTASIENWTDGGNAYNYLVN